MYVFINHLGNREFLNAAVQIFQTLDQCSLYMIWTTALACGPRIKRNCTVTSNGLHYDLSPLTRYSQNYVIHAGNKPSLKIILNVCHSVIFEYNALCQMSSGVCLHNSSNSEYVYFPNSIDTNPLFGPNYVSTEAKGSGYD